MRKKPARSLQELLEPVIHSRRKDGARECGSNTAEPLGPLNQRMGRSFREGETNRTNVPPPWCPVEADSVHCENSKGNGVLFDISGDGERKCESSQITEQSDKCSVRRLYRMMYPRYYAYRYRICGNPPDGHMKQCHEIM
ncbi:hypothetical protein E5288_WYG009684 [Bos mutus]|uniref:Uncharacterized protein n=1 Tax=Bos mutus TaxID=72004 RepID=A0A6B0QX16_9CETA|nr:hypothetical protein [Bos mutus]